MARPSRTQRLTTHKPRHRQRYARRSVRRASANLSGGVVGDEVMGCGAGDSRGHEVAGLRVAGRDVHEPVVARPPGETVRCLVLAPLACRDEHLDLPTYLL